MNKTAIFIPLETKVCSMIPMPLLNLSLLPERYGISTNTDRTTLPGRLVHHFHSIQSTTYDPALLRIDEDEKAAGHYLFSPSSRMSVDMFHQALSQVSFLKAELKASGERASESSSSDLSYEEEFILWMLEEWQLSLPVAERTSVDYVIHSLGTGEFYEHLTPGEPELGYVLEAWEYVRSTTSSDRFAKIKTLANYVPYALQRVGDYLTELSSMDLLLFEVLSLLLSPHFPFLPPTSPYRMFPYVPRDSLSLSLSVVASTNSAGDPNFARRRGSDQHHLALNTANDKYSASNIGICLGVIGDGAQLN